MRPRKLYVSNKYTKEILEPIVRKSVNYTEVCRHFGIYSSGAAWRYIKDKIKEHNIDVSHFLAKRSTAINNKRNRKSFLYLLILREDGIKTKTIDLRKAMIEANIEHKCSKCSINKWNDFPLTLEIHHIDGNNLNNNKENLTFLCPNCHSQTPNFGAKNKKW